MSMVIKLAALGVSLMFSLGACANNQGLLDNQKCKHNNPKNYVIKVTLDEKKKNKPEVDKDIIIACEGDIITFRAKKKENLSIKFPDGDTPFVWKSKSNKDENNPLEGEVTGTVDKNPPDCPTIYKYDVVDDDSGELLDPRIIITPK